MWTNNNAKCLNQNNTILQKKKLPHQDEDKDRVYIYKNAYNIIKKSNALIRILKHSFDGWQNMSFDNDKPSKSKHIFLVYSHLSLNTFILRHKQQHLD